MQGCGMHVRHLSTRAQSECELLPLLPRVQAKKPGLPGGSEGAKAIPKGGGKKKKPKGKKRAKPEESDDQEAEGSEEVRTG